MRGSKFFQFESPSLWIRSLETFKGPFKKDHGTLKCFVGKRRRGGRGVGFRREVLIIILTVKVDAELVRYMYIRSDLGSNNPLDPHLYFTWGLNPSLPLLLAVAHTPLCILCTPPLPHFASCSLHVTQSVQCWRVNISQRRILKQFCKKKSDFLCFLYFFLLAPFLHMNNCLGGEGGESLRGLSLIETPLEFRLKGKKICFLRKIYSASIFFYNFLWLCCLAKF